MLSSEITITDNVELLDVDPGYTTNRTVVTFVGEPQNVIDAAFLAIQKAEQLIDMRNHSGAHARMGATDVCPLVPVSNITMEETSDWAEKLAEKVGTDFYENALKQKNNGGTPLKIGADLVVFLASSASDGITGKLISAPWDKWKDWPEHLDELEISDVYSLRRIVGRDRGFDWGDV